MGMGTDRLNFDCPLNAEIPLIGGDLPDCGNKKKEILMKDGDK